MESRHRTHPAYSKVPEVTAFFWIVKALTTGMGESTSDFLVHECDSRSRPPRPRQGPDRRRSARRCD